MRQLQGASLWRLRQVHQVWAVLPRAVLPAQRPAAREGVHLRLLRAKARQPGHRHGSPEAPEEDLLLAQKQDFPFPEDEDLLLPQEEDILLQEDVHLVAE